MPSLLGFTDFPSFLNYFRKGAQEKESELNSGKIEKFPYENAKQN